MSPDFFNQQWQRLVNRFGPKAMDAELKRLVAAEVSEMSEGAFLGCINVWIGSRKHTNAPLLAEFREARLYDEKLRFERDVRYAVKAFEHPAVHNGLRRFLALEYPGAKTLWEAVEIQRLRNRLAAAEEIP